MPDRVKEKLVKLIFGWNKKCHNHLCNQCNELADHLIANGVTVQTEDEQRNTYTVQEINELQNEAYDLGVESALHHHFGLSWDDAAGLRREIQRLQDATKWIPVTEWVPDKEGRYLCVVPIGKSGAVYVQVMNGDRHGFSLEHIYNDDVTHWMPLPEPPKGE